jgi:hypothetical protein
LLVKKLAEMRSALDAIFLTADGFDEVLSAFNRIITKQKTAPETALLLILREYNVDEVDLKKLAGEPSDSKTSR